MIGLCEIWEEGVSSVGQTVADITKLFLRSDPQKIRIGNQKTNGLPVLPEACYFAE